jgi:hypothetical protein
VSDDIIDLSPLLKMRRQSGCTHIIDLSPLLKMRRQSGCTHSVLLVEEALAELECEALVAEHEAKVKVEHERAIAHMNARAAQLRADVETLEAKKRQLMTEQIGGQTLGQLVKRWRRT